MNPEKPHVKRFLLGDLPPELLLDELGQFFSIQANESVAVEHRYLDSFDWRLHQSGFALVEVVCPSEHYLEVHDLKHNRMIDSISTERSPRVSSDLPPTSSTEVIRKALGLRALLPQIEERVHTRKIKVFDHNKNVLANLVIHSQGCLNDPGSGKKYPIPASLLFEPVPQPPDSFIELRSMLDRKLQHFPDHHPLFDSLKLSGHSPGTSSFTHLSPQERSDHAVKKVLLAELSKMTDNEPGLRIDIDTEFLHDYRVALRRSRTILGEMKQVLPHDCVQYFRSELKWLGDVTGPTRDLDVYLLLLQSEAVSRLGIHHPGELEPLRKFLLARRESRQQQLLDDLDSPRYQVLLYNWRKFLETETLSDAPVNASLPIITTVSRRIWRLYRRIIRLGEAITHNSPDIDLHRLRLECKKLRYLLEAFQSLYPARQIARLIRALKRLQDNLGTHQDCVVQNKLLTGFAKEMAPEEYPVESFLAMGRLSALLDDQQTSEREAFHDRFLEFTRKKNQKRFKKLFKNA